MLAITKNAACDIGPSRFDWWKDWRGQKVAIIASGPSLRKEDIILLEGKIPVLAIKENYRLCKWADVIYGCDEPWWRYVKGLPDHKCLKITHSQRAANEFGLKTIEIPVVAGGRHSDELLLDEPGIIGGGGNSGFQALNIAAQFGATGILLLGFDSGGKSGQHWYGRNGWPKANNPDSSHYAQWKQAFDGASIKLKSIGVEVFNASFVTSLKCFERRSVKDVLEHWKL